MAWSLSERDKRVIAWVSLTIILFLLLSNFNHAVVVNRNYCVAAPFGANTWININGSFTDGSGAGSCFSFTGENITINIDRFAITSGSRPVGFRDFVAFVGPAQSFRNITITSNDTTGRGVIYNATNLFLDLNAVKANVTVEKFGFKQFGGGLTSVVPANVSNFTFQRMRIYNGSGNPSAFIDLDACGCAGINISYNTFWNTSRGGSGSGTVFISSTNLANAGLGSASRPVAFHNNNITDTYSHSGLAYALKLNQSNNFRVYSNLFLDYGSGAARDVYLGGNDTNVSYNTFHNTTLSVLWDLNPSIFLINNTIFNNTLSVNKTGVTVGFFGLDLSYLYNNTVTINTSDLSTGVLFLLNSSKVDYNPVTGNNNKPVVIGGINTYTFNSTYRTIGAVSLTQGDPYMQLINTDNNTFFDSGSLLATVISSSSKVAGTITELMLTSSKYNNFTDQTFRYAANYTINSSDSYFNYFLSPALPATPIYTLKNAADNFTVAWYSYFQAEYPNDTKAEGANLNLTSLNTSAVVVPNCITNSTGFCSTKYNVSQFLMGNCGLVIPMTACWDPNYNNHSFQGSLNSKYNQTEVNITGDNTYILEIAGLVVTPTPSPTIQAGGEEEEEIILPNGLRVIRRLIRDQSYDYLLAILFLGACVLTPLGMYLFFGKGKEKKEEGEVEEVGWKE